MTRRFATVAAFLFSTAVAATTTYCNIFSYFAPYDDEGFFLNAARDFHEADGLYDRVCFPLYGPLHFEIIEGLFSLLRLPYTHDAARLVATVIWTATSLASGIVIFAVSRNIVLGVAAQLLTMNALLLPMVYEASLHPAPFQSLFLLLLIASAFAIPRHFHLAAIAQGVLLSALCLIKLNVGIFALLAIAAFWASTATLGRLRPFAMGLTTLPIVTLPLFLMKGTLADVATQRLLVVFTASAIAVILVLWSDTAMFRFPPAVWLLGATSALAVTIASVAIVLRRGTTLARLIHDVLFLGSQFITLAYSRVNLGRFDRALAIAGLASCIAAVLLRRFLRRSTDVVMISAIARMAVGAVLAYSVSGIFRTLPLGFLFAPFAWVALYPLFSPAERTHTALRRVAVLLAVMQTLQTYPVEKVLLSSFLFVIVALLCVHDGFVELQSVELKTPAVRAAAATILALVVGAGTGRSLQTIARRYAAGSPLALPGCTRIRLESEQANALVRTVALLNTSCNRLLTIPGMMSFYLWTGQRPPTSLNATAWMYLLTNEQQQQIVSSVRDRDRVCVAALGDVIARSGGEDSPRPLVSYIARNFTVVSRNGDYSVMTQRR